MGFNGVDLLSNNRSSQRVPTSDDTGDQSPAQSSPPTPLSANFEKDRHLVYLEMMYELLPYHYQSQENNRLTLVHFIISGLNFLGARDRVDKDVVANWVLSFQAFPSNRASLKKGDSTGSTVQGVLSFP